MGIGCAGAERRGRAAAVKGQVVRHERSQPAQRGAGTSVRRYPAAAVWIAPGPQKDGGSSRRRASVSGRRVAGDPPHMAGFMEEASA